MRQFGKQIVDLTSGQRVSILIGIFIAGIAAVFALDPIPQDPNYHVFADKRGFLGIPNFNDVASNLGFAIVGVLGVASLSGVGHREIFVESHDGRPYVVFFIGIALVSLGSAYYHWEPTNERLLWDRVPMSIGFMAISAAVAADRIDARIGNIWLLPALVALGLASLVYWDWTQSSGRGDLRFYALVQFYPMIVLPVIVGLFREYRYTPGRYLVWVIAWYGLSKVFEYFDTQLFEVTGGNLSGHTLKHLAAAVATLVVLRMLVSRKTTSTSRG